MRPNFSRLALPFFVCLLLGCAACASHTFGQAKQKEPLAVVAGQPIYDDDLLPFVQAQVFQLRVQEYEVKSKALENLVNQKLLEAEAKKKGIPTEKVLNLRTSRRIARVPPIPSAPGRFQRRTRPARLRQPICLAGLHSPRRPTR